MERLRALVGRGGWDFCAHWELSSDQRSLELKACCCGGADGSGEDDASLPWECRDVSFPRHQRTRACTALADLPPSVPLESNSSTTTSHAQVFLSGIPAWAYPSQLLIRPNCSDEERRTTRVLVPVPGGVIELFVENHVLEDRRTVEFIASQFAGQIPATAFAGDYQLHRDLEGYCGMADENPAWSLQPAVPPSDHHCFPWDPSSEQSRLCVSPLDLFEAHREDDAFFEGSSDSVHSDKRPFPFDPLPGFHRPGARPAAQIAYTAFGESALSRELGGHDKESIKQEGEGRTDSFLDGSDQMGDDDDEQKMGRSERRPSCKNLMAERKRRKKLNDRLYDLRSLVPKISKMDKASILGDAIEFVKDLQNQVKKLQDQLDETTPADGGAAFDAVGGPHLIKDNHDIQQIENKDRSSSMMMSSNTCKDPRRSPIIEKKENQMEPQVEVSQIGANKFFLRVFCEHRRGGFVRLMEAMASLGFDVINLNVTTSEPLVLNVFEVEKRDSEAVQADQVRSSLLRLAMDADDSRLQL